MPNLFTTESPHCQTLRQVGRTAPLIGTPEGLLSIAGGPLRWPRWRFIDLSVISGLFQGAESAVYRFGSPGATFKCAVLINPQTLPKVYRRFMTCQTDS